MSEVTIGGIIKTAIVSAFTIAAALIWKDVIIEIITMFVPVEQRFFYKLLVAIIATAMIIVIIYLLLEAQKETEVVLRKYKDRKLKEEMYKKRIEMWKKKLKKERKKRKKLREKMKKLKKARKK